MKIIAINGSPRKGWNTETLLQKALDGAAFQGAETELIQLSELDYKGCTSCFACKKINGIRACATRDGLTSVLNKTKESDGLIFGSPIYFGGITSGMGPFWSGYLLSIHHLQPGYAQRISGKNTLCVYLYHER
jgi:multimeric flavodoxin WrbA